MDQLNAAIEIIRAAMVALGYEVVERPLPTINRDDSRGSAAYYPGAHSVRLPAWADESTLWHELCHSQQPFGANPVYHRPDGSIDGALWFADPREQQAMAIEALVGQRDWRNLCAVAADAPLREHATIIKMAAAHGAAATRAAIEAARVAASDVTLVPDWIRWILRGELAHHPERLPRRARQAANAAQAAIRGAA